MYCFLFAGESHLAPAPFRPVAKNQRRPISPSPIVCIYLPTGTYRHDAPISHERKFVVEIFTCSRVYLDLFWKKKKNLMTLLLLLGRKKKLGESDRTPFSFGFLATHPPTLPTWQHLTHSYAV
jgi:hypothetical protein